jgi:opacity protein-like surface antigen
LKLLKVAAWSAVLLAVSAVPVRADGFVIPYIGFNFGGNSNCETLTNCEDEPWNFGVSVGSKSSVVGFEADIAWAKDFFGKVPGADNSVFTLMSNVVIGPSGRVQPYFLAGVGLIRPHTSFNVADTITSFSDNSIGYDFGFGVNGYFTKSVGIRGDVRRFKTFQDLPRISGLSDEHLMFWRVSIGLAFRF